MVMDCLGRCFKSVSSISYKYGKLGETVSESRTLAVKNGTTGETMTATMGYVSNYLGQMEQVMYPDGETVGYGYDAGGQVTSVIGNHYGHDFVYVQILAMTVQATGRNCLQTMIAKTTAVARFAIR